MNADTDSRPGDVAGAGGMGPGDPFPATRHDEAAEQSGNGSTVIGAQSDVVRGPIPRLPPRHRVAAPMARS
jgi:hypothetical protein